MDKEAGTATATTEFSSSIPALSLSLGRGRGEGERSKLNSRRTTIPGNWNTGHEWWFYPKLTDADRYDIIEFLKTFNEEGDYQFTRPAAAQLPETVRVNHPLPTPTGASWAQPAAAKQQSQK